MKQKSTNFILLVLAIFVFSCSKDKDSTPTNNFSYNGKSYSIKTAYSALDPDGMENNGVDIYYHDIVFLSDGFTISNHNVSGKGNALALNIVSGTGAITVGTYNFNEDEDSHKPDDFSYGAVFLNYNTSDQTGEWLQLTSGKITIAKSGDTYTIDLDGTVNGSAVKAHYSGLLPPL